MFRRVRPLVVAAGTAAVTIGLVLPAYAAITRHLETRQPQGPAATHTVDAGSAPVAAIPDGQNFAGYRTAGALFASASLKSHFCSASVVASSSQNLIITAGHCVVGTGTGLYFVPGYHNGKAPYGVWSVTAAFATPGWRNSNGAKTTDDYAILRLAPNAKGQNVQQVVGANTLRIDSPTGKNLVVGYPDGPDSTSPKATQKWPVRCTADTYRLAGALAFNCNGYPGGVSGGPFLMHFNSKTESGQLDGLIGGYHQGGCVDYRSFSPDFNASTAQLLQQAESGAAGETLPTPPSDGCPA